MKSGKLISILEELHPDVDYGTNIRLVGEGILTSLDIVTLVGEINDAFDISIPAHEITEENFNSVSAITALIQRLEEMEA